MDKRTENHVVDIISKTFDDNPMINFIVKQDTKRKTRIRDLAKYSFRRCARRDGVFLSNDGKGVALCYRNQAKGNWRDILDQIELIFKVIGIGGVSDAQKRESYRAEIRSKDPDYLYFWFLGVLKGGEHMAAVKELRDTIFDLSDQLKLPIYLETTLPKNKLVYERYGFQTIHEWEVPGSNGITMWFMRRGV